LQIVTTAGCVSEVSRYIFGVPAPDVQFYTNTGCSGVPVCFSDQSTSLISPISVRNWNFGDPQSGNNTSADSAVCHTYQMNGSFQAILRVNNFFGCSDSLIKSINIHQSPNVGFIYLDSCSSETIQFIDTTTYASWNPCLQRIWNWGDGTRDTVPNPVHKFPGPGSYNISLDIKSLQCLNRYIRTVLIKPVPLSLFNAQDVCEGVPVEFTNLSNAPGDTILESQWIFDSLGFSSLTNPSFLFPEPGNFTVNLSVTTSSNCIHDTSFVIQVYTRPSSGFDYTIIPHDPEFEVCFTNQSVNATTYLWNFGDNQFSSLFAPCHFYPTGDTFTVTLHAINSALCADSIQKKLFVDSPFMDLILKEFTLENKNDKLLLNLSLSNNSNRFWENFYVQIEQDGQQFFWLELDTILPPYSDFTMEREIPGIHLFNTTHKYYCVTTGNQNIFESNMTNNSLCKLNVVVPELLSYTIVENIITLNFIVPDIDIFYLKLYSLDGNLVQSHEYNNIKSGIVDLQYSSFGIQSGIYIIEYYTKSFMSNIKIFIN
jgi:PKD repeat protein